VTRLRIKNHPASVSVWDRCCENDITLPSAAAAAAEWQSQCRYQVALRVAKEKKNTVHSDNSRYLVRLVIPTSLQYVGCTAVGGCKTTSFIGTRLRKEPSSHIACKFVFSADWEIIQSSYLLWKTRPSICVLFYSQKNELVQVICMPNLREYLSCMLRQSDLEVQLDMPEWTILQRTVFINKIRMLQRTQMLQRTILYAFIMESSIIVFTRGRLFTLFMCVRLFMLLLGKVCS
jgi:hypothetical protein